MYPGLASGASVTSLHAGASRFFAPDKNVNSMINAYSNNLAPNFLTISPTALAEPPTL